MYLALIVCVCISVYFVPFDNDCICLCVCVLVCVCLLFSESSVWCVCVRRWRQTCLLSVVSPSSRSNLVTTLRIPCLYHHGNEENRQVILCCLWFLSVWHGRPWHSNVGFTFLLDSITFYICWNGSILACTVFTMFVLNVFFFHLDIYVYIYRCLQRQLVRLGFDCKIKQL